MEDKRLLIISNLEGKTNVIGISEKKPILQMKAGHSTICNNKTTMLTLNGLPNSIMDSFNRIVRGYLYIYIYIPVFLVFGVEDSR